MNKGLTKANDTSVAKGNKKAKAAPAEGGKLSKKEQNKLDKKLKAAAAKAGNPVAQKGKGKAEE